MATAILLSRHSSNPLEVGSSDPRNSYYHSVLNAANKHEKITGLTSDDLPNCSVTQRATYVDLDEDAEEGDELNLIPVNRDASRDEEGNDDEIDELVPGRNVGSEELEEEMTIYNKSSEERAEILEEMNDLEQAVPQLSADYKIIDRLGHGTFSSVYKGIDLGYHDKWYNDPWKGHHPPSSSAYYQSAPSPKDSKVFVAVKRIYVTSSPERIRNEISIMEDCRSCRHTSQLITAFRQADQVVVIMPYHRHDDFREYFRDLSLPGIKAYFRCMFRALRDIHARAIIHRDVKPANFLFDPVTGIGTLCDFGLASRIEPLESGTCFHTSASSEYPHGTLKSRSEWNSEEIKAAQLHARQLCTLPSEKVGFPDKDTRPVAKANRAGTRGFRAPEVLLKCNDQSGAVDVWAAGMILLFFLTGKFPLLNSNDDVEALMEIATIIGSKKMEKVATLHCRTFATNVPSVTPNGMPWRDFVERQNETLYEPRDPDPGYWPYNIYISSPLNPSTHLEADLSNHVPAGPPSSSSSPPPLPLPSSSSPTGLSKHVPSSALGKITPAQHGAEIDSAFDLLEKLMQPESIRRITAEQVLAHPFLRQQQTFDEEVAFFDDEAPDDDEFIPHLWGKEGNAICREWHFRDDETGVLYVKVWEQCGCGCGEVFEEVMAVEAGEGVAVGRLPCEVHQHMQ